jgi:hypothetical protein
MTDTKNESKNLVRASEGKAPLTRPRHNMGG